MIIGITAGDPKGIGPEIISKALPQLPVDIRNRCRIFGDLSLDPKKISDTDAAQAALAALDAAIADARAGKIGAIVTAPVNKKRLQLLRPDFTGHTDELARATGTPAAVMFFVSDVVRIGLVTHHVPLREVAAQLSVEKIVTATTLVNEHLKKFFGIVQPTMAMLSVNPHAGESGALGREEIETIIPAITAAKCQGINCSGPFAADSFFARGKQAAFAAVIAMYHDQGLIPAKLLGQDRIVNVTLGLPFLRTSPAHGTAEDIAGKNIADPSGMIAAIELAAR